MTDLAPPYDRSKLIDVYQQAPPPPEVRGIPAPTCVRRAWLTLGSYSVPLEGVGYFCTKLDLGSPIVREVVNNKPDQWGQDDRTQLLGSRIVTAEITALAGAGAVIDDVASRFAPFMDPSQRPVLHYVLDRPGTPERTLTLRAANYTWPIVGPYQRDIQLQWVAADPVARSAVTKTAFAWAGIEGGPGRTYDLRYDRSYPAGGGAATTAHLVNDGDVNVYPLLRVHGPGGAIVIEVWNQYAWGVAALFDFLPSFVLNAGDYVDIDCARRLVYLNGDPTQSLYDQVQWGNVAYWPFIPPSRIVPYLVLGILAEGASGITQVQAYWQDGFMA
jgi:hypothetical protein